MNISAMRALRRIKLTAESSYLLVEMPPFASSAAVQVFDLIFSKYIVYCSRIVGLDISKTKFMNAATFAFLAFLFLALFSVIYTTLTAQLEIKLIALAALGPILQV